MMRLVTWVKPDKGLSPGQSARTKGIKFVRSFPADQYEMANPDLLSIFVMGENAGPLQWKL